MRLATVCRKTLAPACGASTAARRTARAATHETAGLESGLPRRDGPGSGVAVPSRRSSHDGPRHNAARLRAWSNATGKPKPDGSRLSPPAAGIGGAVPWPGVLQPAGRASLSFHVRARWYPASMQDHRPAKRRRRCPPSPDRPGQRPRVDVTPPVDPAKRDLLGWGAKLATLLLAARVFGIDIWNMIRPRQRAEVRISGGSRHEVRGSATLTLDRPDDGRVLRV